MKRKVYVISAGSHDLPTSFIQECRESVRGQLCPLGVEIVHIVHMDFELLGAAHSRLKMVDVIRGMNPSDNDIVIMIDLDDYFFNEMAVATIIKAYDAGADITYGSYIALSGHKTPTSGYDDQVLREKSFRSAAWKFWPARSFSWKLVKQLRPDHFCFPDGTWFRKSTDVAFSFPLLERAENPVFLKEKLYVYRNNYQHTQQDPDPCERTKVSKYLQSLPFKH